MPKIKISVSSIETTYKVIVLLWCLVDDTSNYIYLKRIVLQW